jgi:hypothetical protein
MKPGPVNKNSHELTTDQTTDTAEKSRTCTFEILNTANIVCGENCGNVIGSSKFRN